MNLVSPLRQLEIVGQKYLLNIIPIEKEVPNTWVFQLENKRKDGLVPGGFKLRLIAESGGILPQGEVEATKAECVLNLEIVISPGTILYWEIEPLPDNYQKEILIF